MSLHCVAMYLFWSSSFVSLLGHLLLLSYLLSDHSLKQVLILCSMLLMNHIMFLTLFRLENMQCIDRHSLKSPVQYVMAIIWPSLRNADCLFILFSFVCLYIILLYLGVSLLLKTWPI